MLRMRIYGHVLTHIHLLLLLLKVLWEIHRPPG